MLDIYLLRHIYIVSLELLIIASIVWFLVVFFRGAENGY